MIFCDSYLPGYKGGGGMWAVYNLADRLKDDFDFFIFTRDCDGKLDQTPFVHAARDKWNERPEAKVFYASPAKLNRNSIESLVDEVSPDLIYLNSVFSYVCVKFLMMRRKSRTRSGTVLLAPCGEFANAALKIKSAKKRSFLAFARISNLFDGICWRASSNAEHSEIRAIAGNDVPIEISPELTPKVLFPDFDILEKPEKEVGAVRLACYSHITPKRNLLFLIECLKQIKTGTVELEIVGPTDDEAYLRSCMEAASRLPPNIDVHFAGGKTCEEGLSMLIENHFVVFPTHNENFSNVIIESLAAGCPLIVSDQIVWKEAEDLPFITRNSLDDPAAWVRSLNESVMMNGDIFRERSLAARQFAVRWLEAHDSFAICRGMLNRIFEGNK